MQAAVALAVQLVLVLGDGWGSTHGELRRYVRDGDGWHQAGAAIPVALGENGLAWGRGLHPRPPSGEPIKQEGDRRSPAGLFKLGAAYGGESDLVCVDDPRSRDYNRIVPNAPRGEPMRMYRRAVVIGHNAPPPKPGAGSCVFLHDGDSPTVGCTAMAPAALDELVAWLRDGALIVQLPRPVYRRVKASWKLPGSGG